MQKLLTLVSRAAAYSSALFLTAMMSITVADVTLRALFNLPITGAYDLVQLFLVGTVFLSIPDVFLRDENIAIDLIDHIIGRTAVGLLKTFANVAASVFLLVLSWQMIQPALDSIHFHEVSTDLSIPMIVHWCLMIAGIVLAVPAALALLIESVRHLAGAHEFAMNTQVVSVVGFAVMIGLIFMRVPVAISLGIVGTVGYAALNGWAQALTVFGRVPLTFTSAYDLSVVPLFVLMGAIAAHSGMARELFQSINVMFSGRRGTLATATVGACAALGAVSGSSVAMVATMSHVAIPEMRRVGYDERLALGSVVAGGTLGILIPPSVMLIFYGLTAVQSIPKLFAAGFVPGLLLAGLQIGVVKLATWIAPHWAPVSPRAPWRERLRASIGIWKLLFIFLLSIGGIYVGWFSPTEAAAVGCFATIVIAGATGKLTFKQFADSVIESSRTTAMLFFILIGAIMFSYFTVQTQVATNLANWVVSLHLPPTAVMVVVVLFYIVLGSFLESLTMVLITVPVFAPLAQGLGYDLVWFGVLLVVLIEVGLIHPPMGMNLFVLQAQLPDARLGMMYAGSAMFLLANAVLIALLLAFPDIALWLPRVLY